MASGRGVLVTRPRRQATRFARRLRCAGIGAFVAPVIEVVPLASWQMPQRAVQALLVTSANAVPALRPAAAALGVEPLVACVGPDTAAAARRAGFGRVVAAAGTADSLADLVGRRLDPAAGALLHLCGRDVAGDLPGRLGRRGFVFERRVVYEARPRLALPAHAARLLQGGRLGAVVLFSPRGAAIFVDLVAKAGLTAKLRRLTALTISANAAAAAGDGWAAVRIAAAPHGAAMLALAADAVTSVKGRNVE